MSFLETLGIIGFIGGYFVLMRWVFPWLGIPT
jgi:hypothetical protein